MTAPTPLVVANIALSFHRAVAAVTRHILEAHGHQVTGVEAPHEKMFAQLAAGQADLLVSAWLPSSHDAYLNPHQCAALLCGAEGVQAGRVRDLGSGARQRRRFRTWHRGRAAPGSPLRTA